jgi:acetyl esterase
VIDPELQEIIGLLPSMDLSDPVAARAGFAAMLAGFRMAIPGIETLEIEDRLVPGWEGDPEVSVRLYRPQERKGSAPGVLHIHGGGFIIGSVEAEHGAAAMTAISTGAIVVSVEYRLAPEHPFPAAVHDCYQALVFLHGAADELGVDTARLVVEGTSAGGGLAAATALLARDLGGPALSFQLLQIPELDDRLETWSMRTFVDSPMWNRPLAEVSWRAYLGADADLDDVSPYAAPARATDLSGLPPAYILQAGVSVELHQFPGTFHGSAMVASAAITQRAQRESTVVLRRALGFD